MVDAKKGHMDGTAGYSPMLCPSSIIIMILTAYVDGSLLFIVPCMHPKSVTNRYRVQ